MLPHACSFVAEATDRIVASIVERLNRISDTSIRLRRAGDRQSARPLTLFRHTRARRSASGCRTHACRDRISHKMEPALNSLQIIRDMASLVGLAWDSQRTTSTSACMGLGLLLIFAVGLRWKVYKTIADTWAIYNLGVPEAATRFLKGSKNGYEIVTLAGTFIGAQQLQTDVLFVKQ